MGSSDGVQLLFPPLLTARQRAAIHAAGEQSGLPHVSAGEGAERRISLGPAGGTVVNVTADSATTGGLSDTQLIEIIQKHLNIDATPAFAAAGSSAGAGAAGGGGRRAAPRGKRVNASKAAQSKPSSKRPVSVDDFVEQVLPLLELERAAEVAQAEEALSGCSPAAAAARGRALLNLQLTEAEGGLLGRTLLTLVNNKGSGSDPLPAHKFAPHDIVRLRPSKSPADAAAGPALAEGVVYRVADSQIIVAVDELPEDGGLDVPLRLEKLANEVTYQRLRAALQGLRGESGQAGVAAPLVDVLFGRRAPRFVPSPPPWKPLNPGLDDSQQAAVAKALAAQDLALVHGPPGTGKTTAVVEYVCQEVARGSRVLACAASNVAVDNLVERLAAQKPGGKAVRVVRVGHPARLLPQVLANSLEAKVLQSDNSALAKDCRKEMKALSSRLLKLGRKDYAERRQLRQELRQLSKEERKRQERAVEEVLKGAQVVCTTLTGVGQRQLERLAFDVVAIDEAAQALEPACWAALLKGRRAVLAGDHLQLPPTVVSEEAARRGLARTLFERLQELWGEAVSQMLTVQYRMNSDIMDWSSQEMYGGQLQGHGSVASHALGGLRGAGAAAGDVPVLLLVDTAGCDMEEQEEEEGASTWNEGEARVVMAHVRRLLDAGVPAREIGVITPYAAQVARLRELRPEALAGQLEISTVDGFQGREKEAIVISMVRSNPRGTVGFLADARRMNVAVTRARRHCALVCDSETVGADPFLRRLVEYFEARGDYSSAGEFEAG